MATEIEVFRRLLSRRIWLSRNGLLLILYSVVAALSLTAVLGTFFLLIDLLSFRGRIEVVPAEQNALAPLITTVDERGVAEDTGIRSILWRHRSCPVVARVMRPLSRVIPLRTNRGALAMLVLLGVLVSILRALSLQRARAKATELVQESTNSWRSQIHRQILRLGPGDLDQRDYSSAQGLFVQSVESISLAMTNLLATGVYQWVSIGCILAVMLAMDWAITIQALVPLLAGAALIRWEQEQGTQRRSLVEAQASGDLRILSEGLRKSRIVRGFGMEAFEQERFLKHLDRYSLLVRSGAMTYSWSLWGARVIGALLIGIVVFLVGSRVLGVGKTLDLPVALAVLTGFVMLGPLLKGIMERSAVRQSVIIDGAAIHRFLSILPEVGQAVGAKFIEPTTKSIQFEGVSYQRGDQTLLKDFELRIPAGSVTALISLDPLEARAAAALLPRFIEPQGGRVLFDGEDIAWGTLESIRAETIYVGGDDPCFTGTVTENIRCGDPRYDSPAVMEAAKLVHAHQFIQRLPLGYETQLGEHGEQLTVGQMFLLGLARAVIRNPAVIVIEEPTETLDQATKDYLDDAYPRITAERTVVFVPTRLSTIRRCDRVVVIDDGHVEAVGPQAELVKTSEHYRHWEYVTFNAFRRVNEKG